MSIHQFRPSNNQEIINEPERLDNRAIDNLRFIRETMERSTSFTAVPGWGGTLMGVTALSASFIAANQTTTKFWLVTWMAEAVLAFAIGFLAMWQKARILENSLVSAPARKFAFGLLPPLFAGIVLTVLLFKTEQTSVLPIVWLLMYGTAVTTGGMYSVKPVPAMGICFLILGTVAVFAPAQYGDFFMAAGFGVLQIIFGIVIARYHGG
jgi:hypothetical protein